MPKRANCAMPDAEAIRPDAAEKNCAFSDALRRGTRAALEAARDACLADPNEAGQCYAYGQAWMADGKPARAEQAFAVAIKLRQNFSNRLGQLASRAPARRGDPRRPGRHEFRALQGRPAIPPRRAISPNCPGSPAVMRRPKRCCATRWCTNPLDVGARLNLVAERLQEEKPAEALALLNEKVDPPADNLPAARHWRLQRAQA